MPIRNIVLGIPFLMKIHDRKNIVSSKWFSPKYIFSLRQLLLRNKFSLNKTFLKKTSFDYNSNSYVSRQSFWYPLAHCISFQYPPWPKHIFLKSKVCPTMYKTPSTDFFKVYKVWTLKSKHFSEQGTVPKTKV